TPEQRARLRRYFLDHVDTVYPSLRKDRADRLSARSEFEKTVPIAMVMQDLAQPRDTFILKRGQYDQPGEKVEPDVPAALQSLPAGSPRNRLGLAKWMVDPANPLTARVAVNRWW